MTLVVDYCASHREAVLGQIRGIVQRHTSQQDMYQLMLDYPLRPAKGLRPALCLATSRALGANEDTALPTAAVLELLHNAFLIHDDIEDGSHYRRGGPTLQRQHGMPTAVNVADGMLALAIPPLLENSRLVGLGKALAVLEYVAQMVIITVEGQATELAWTSNNVWRFDEGGYRAAYEQLVVEKTAHYSFIAPVELGCILAGSSQLQPHLAAFAKHLGIAFQITDDLLNLRSDAAGYGKEFGGDLWEGKRTLMLLHALHHALCDGHDEAQGREALRILAKGRGDADAAQRTRANEVLSQLRDEGGISARAHAALAEAVGGDAVGNKTATEVAFLDSFIRDNGGVAYATKVAAEHSALAAARLSDCNRSLAPGHARDFLHALVDYVVERLR